MYEDIKGVTYESNFQPYASQEKIIYDYREADFHELFERGLVSTENDEVADYISFQSFKEYFGDYATCQEFKDNEQALYKQMIGPLTLDLEATELNTDLFNGK